MGTVKRVRFSPFPKIYRDIPWIHSGEANPLLSDHDVLFPLRTNLQEPSYSLRTEMDAGGSLTLRDVAILGLVLFLLFFVIWLIVHKVLMLEIESQIQQPNGGNEGQFGRSRRREPF
jgi:hypothetical protein